MKIKRIISSVLSLCFVTAATIVSCPEGDFFASARGEVSINETIVIEDGKLVSGNSALIDNGYIVVGDVQKDKDLCSSVNTPKVFATNNVADFVSKKMISDNDTIGTKADNSYNYTYQGIKYTDILLNSIILLRGLITT